MMLLRCSTIFRLAPIKLSAAAGPMDDDDIEETDFIEEKSSFRVVKQGSLSINYLW